MVLVWLRGLREFRTKFAQPPQPFPTHLPRAAKIKPKTVRNIHKEGQKIEMQISILPLLAKTRSKQLLRIFGG